MIEEKRRDHRRVEDGSSKIRGWVIEEKRRDDRREEEGS